MNGSGRFLERIGWAVISICMLLALLHGLFLLITPEAPLREKLSDQFVQGVMEQSISERESWFTDAARGANLAMHFPGFTPDDKWLARYYFLAQFALYPKKAIVGRGDRIINAEADIYASDQLQSDAWMKEQGVGGIMTIRKNPDGAIHVETQLLPSAIQK